MSRIEINKWIKTNVYFCLSEFTKTEIKTNILIPTKSNTHLTQIQGEVDFVVLSAGGERRALPPPFRSINCMDGWMCLPGILRIAVVTVLALGRRKGLLHLFSRNIHNSGRIACSYLMVSRARLCIAASS